MGIREAELTVVTTSVSLLPFILADKDTLNNGTVDNNTQYDAAVEQKINNIEDWHQMALSSGFDTYSDPATGFAVFTELAHLKQGGGLCAGMDDTYLINQPDAVVPGVHSHIDQLEDVHLSLNTGKLCPGPPSQHPYPIPTY
eukprot:5999124-Ditylum_brightwellii.AAC.1